MSFFEELKRRKVIRVAIAYGIGAWLLLQLAEVLTELLSLPESVGPIVVGIVVLGFPVVVVLAWVFELTSEGLKRDSEVAPGERSSGKLINALVIGLLVVALGYFVWESRFQGAAGEASRSGADTAAMNDAPGQRSATARIGRSIAVLPFENFSGDASDAYFADGLTDTLLHKLAQLEALKVIARNSSFQYKGSNQDVREIGAALGVETILEGSVQRAGDQVRIIAQLVRTSDGAHVWSKTFDDTLDNLFALQDRVAGEIVDAFEISLSAAEREQLMRDGTSDPEAYDLLMQALNIQRSVDEMTDTRAENDQQLVLLQQVVARDPEYAEAWAYLARAWNGLAFATDSGTDWNHYVAESEAAASKAIALDPELAMAHSALGWVAHRRGERIEAERHFRRALELNANELGAMSGLALQIGFQDPEAALALLDRSIAIDPKSPITQRQRHFMLFNLDRWDEAIAALERAIELAPDEGIYTSDLHDLYELRGRPDQGAVATSRLLRRSPASFTGQAAMAEAWIAALDFERAGEWVRLLLRDRADSDRGKPLEADRLMSAGRHEEALTVLATLDDNRRTDWQLRYLATVSCLTLERLECARREHQRFIAFAEERALRGEPTQAYEAVAGLLGMALRELEGDQVAAVDLERLLSALESSPFFRASSRYAQAGLLARLDRIDEALLRLESTIDGPDGAVHNLDFFGATPEASLLIGPLRDQPAFADWLLRYQVRRDDMLGRMIELEARGEILRPGMVERMAGT